MERGKKEEKVERTRKGRVSTPKGTHCNFKCHFLDWVNGYIKELTEILDKKHPDIKGWHDKGLTCAAQCPQERWCLELQT